MRETRPWFVALPDSASTRHLVSTLRSRHKKLRSIPHPSGNPLLIGCWDEETVSVGRSSDTVIVVVGEHSTSSAALDHAATRVRRHGNLRGSTTQFRGSMHVIASLAGDIVMQGTATGLRRIFWARVGHAVVASDDALVLATLIGAQVDRARIATRLLVPFAPWPLFWRPVWEHVEWVRPDHYIVISRDNRVQKFRYWWPPAQDQPLDDAALSLRTALRDAVSLRASPGRTVVSHLSGLDSSSICALAASGNARLVAITCAQPDAMDDDVYWARQTVHGLRTEGHVLDHEVIAAEDVPLVYDGILDADDPLDEPFLLLHNRRRFLHTIERGESYLPAVHLMGLGGDEMCSQSDIWLRELIWRHPIEALSKLRKVAGVNYRSSTRALVASFANREGYTAWLQKLARQIGDSTSQDVSHRGGAIGRWGQRPTPPSWIAQEARELVQNELLDAASNCEEAVLADDAGRQEMLSEVYAGASAMRAFERVARRTGAAVSAPFLDDAVMEAALSVEVSDQYVPGRYKPLLVAAMRDIVPEVTLGRSSKSETSGTAVLGSRTHRDQLIGIATNAHLAKLGLVDGGVLERACRAPIDVYSPATRLETTIGCEIWLRNRQNERNDVRVEA